MSLSEVSKKFCINRFRLGEIARNVLFQQMKKNAVINANPRGQRAKYVFHVPTLMRFMEVETIPAPPMTKKAWQKSWEEEKKRVLAKEEALAAERKARIIQLPKNAEVSGVDFEAKVAAAAALDKLIAKGLKP